MVSEVDSAGWKLAKAPPIPSGSVHRQISWVIQSALINQPSSRIPPKGIRLFPVTFADHFPENRCIAPPSPPPIPGPINRNWTISRAKPTKSQIFLGTKAVSRTELQTWIKISDATPGKPEASKIQSQSGCREAFPPSKLGREIET